MPNYRYVSLFVFIYRVWAFEFQTIGWIKSQKKSSVEVPFFIQLQQMPLSTLTCVHLIYITNLLRVRAQQIGGPGIWHFWASTSPIPPPCTLTTVQWKDICRINSWNKSCDFASTNHVICTKFPQDCHFVHFNTRNGNGGLFENVVCDIPIISCDCWGLFPLFPQMKEKLFV